MSRKELLRRFKDLIVRAGGRVVYSRYNGELLVEIRYNGSWGMLPMDYFDSELDMKLSVLAKDFLKSQLSKRLGQGCDRLGRVRCRNLAVELYVTTNFVVTAALYRLNTDELVTLMRFENFKLSEFADLLEKLSALEGL